MRDPVDLYRDSIHWLENDLWQIRSATIGKWRAFFIHKLRVLVLAVRGFLLDQAPIRASALTYYSMLSLIPLLAMIFGIARGFGLDEKLRTELVAQIPQQQEFVEQIVLYAERFLEQTKGGLIAGIGIILLIWAVIRLLTHIEKAFNHIWKVEQGRNIFRKVADFVSIALLGPLLLLISSSITVYVSSRVTDIATAVDQIGLISQSVEYLLNFTPYVIAWILFAFVYIVMPNRNVPVESNLMAAIVAGTLFQLLQWGYVESQIGVAKYNAVYGSLAALPLFLIWLQLSWMVVLFGAEIAYGIQHVKTYEGIATVKEMSPSCHRLIEITVVHHVVVGFRDHQPPPDAEALSEGLGLPAPIADQALEKSVRAGLLRRVNYGDDEIGYQPAMPLEEYTLTYVAAKLDSIGQHKPPIADRKEVRAISDALDQMHQAISNSDHNRKLTDI